jgi:2-polyprenyl-3-methyl-5-hydroxy-6-metoxy-1,4-benzoquinol methylase
MKTLEEVRQVVNDLSSSVWAFSTLTCAVEVGVLELLTEPRTVTFLSERTGAAPALVECILDVLVPLGLVRREGDTFVSEPGLLPLLHSKEDFLAELRTTYLQSGHFMQSAKQGIVETGWHHTDPEILQSQGRGGRMLTQMLAKQVFPLLDGLEARLNAPSATFLDVGIGVGIISIELCGLYPNLHVVGLEPQEAPLAEARRNIVAAHLGDRIELRAQRVEDLTDNEVFDMVYFPQVFMPIDVVKRGLHTVWKALRPGGWVQLPAISAPGAELGPALTRLRNVLWGGQVLFPEQVADMVREAGFQSVVVGGAPGSMVKGIMGQRPA